MKNNANLVQARIDRAIKEEGDYYAISITVDNCSKKGCV